MVKANTRFLSTLFLSLWMLLNPLPSIAQSVLGMSTNLIVVGTSVYFWGYDNSNHIKLFTVDEGSDSVRQVMDFQAGDDTMFSKRTKVVGTTLYFVAKASGSGEKLFSIEAGSTAAPTQISNTAGVAVDDIPNLLAASATDLYFSANNTDAVDRLYKVNLTTKAVSQVSIGCADAFSVPCNDSPDNLTINGSNVYFSAYDSTGSINIYLEKTGFPAVKLSYPGGDIINPIEFEVLGSSIFISAYDAISGFGKLFVDDGTSTTLVTETNPGSSDDPMGFEVFGNDLYYKSTDATGFNRLYKLTNGTGAPTLLTTINAGANDEPANLNMVGTDLYFSAYADALGNTKLFKLTSGLVRTQITDTATAAYSDNVWVGFVYQNKLFLNSMDVDGFNHGYVYDTQSDTLTKILDRGAGMNSIPARFLTDGDDVYFADVLSKRTGAALYHYNTSSENLVDLSQFSGTTSHTSSIFHASQGQLFFTGGTKNFSTEDLGGGMIGMWSTTLLGSLINGNIGTQESLAPAQTGIYVTGNPNPSNYASISKILFYDFTNSAYSLVTDIMGPGVDDQTNFNIFSAGTDEVYFVATDGAARHLYHSDGVTLTKLSTNNNMADSMTNAKVIGTSLYFESTDTFGVTNLYKADGANALIQFATPSGNFDASRPYIVTASKVYFQGEDATAFNKLYSANLDGSGVTLFSDVNPGASDAYPAIAAIGDDVYFIENVLGTNILFKYDSGSGMTGVIDSTGEVTSNLYSVNNKLYFNQFDGVDYYLNELTTAGLRTVVSNASSEEMTSITKVNSDIYFIGKNSSNTKSALLRYTNTRILSEVEMPDSETIVLNSTMPYADGYLYFMAKSSSGLNEYFRLRN
jgi:hypothetical protein